MAFPVNDNGEILEPECTHGGCTVREHIEKLVRESGIVMADRESLLSEKQKFLDHLSSGENLIKDDLKEDLKRIVAVESENYGLREKMDLDSKERARLISERNEEKMKREELEGQLMEMKSSYELDEEIAGKHTELKTLAAKVKASSLNASKINDVVSKLVFRKEKELNEINVLIEKYNCRSKDYEALLVKCNSLFEYLKKLRVVLFSLEGKVYDHKEKLVGKNFFVRLVGWKKYRKSVDKKWRTNFLKN